MKIEKIAQDKIKITLFDEDLIKFNIDIKNLTSNSEEIRNVFWSILKQAQAEADFNIDGSQLMVEAISRPDSFVMIVTRTPHEKKAKIAKTPVTKPYQFFVFSFPHLNDLKQACSEISPYFKGESILHKYKDEYYLTLNLYDAKKCDALSEYGREIKDVAAISGLLSEYGISLIKENAVENISSFL